jgi:hypothetical protein
MPVWTCPKCGQRVESFSWNEKPWNDHVCRDMRKDMEMDIPDIDRDPLPSVKRNNNLLDFL